MQLLDNGLSMAGLFAVLVNILALSTKLDIEITGGICFLVVSALALVGLVFLSFMERSEFYQHYTNLPQATTNTMVKNKTVEGCFSQFIL